MSHRIIQYVENLDDDTKDELLKDRCTCQALIRTLPPLSKQLILRLAYGSPEVPEEDMEAWSTSKFALGKALDHLIKLRMVIRKEGAAKVGGIAKPRLRTAAAAQKSKSEKWHYSLNTSFGDSMQKILSLGALPEWKLDSGLVLGVSEIEDRTGASRHIILQYLLSKAGTLPFRLPGLKVREPSPRLVSWLHRSGYLGDADRITEAGFRFLFLDRTLQAWSLVMAMLAEDTLRSQRVAILQFIFQISAVPPGKCFHLDSLLSSAQFMTQDVLPYCQELGLIYIRDQYVYPTSLAAELTSEVDRTMESSEFGQGWIVVESNFRVYAYTSALLQIQLLSLFVSVRVCLPNLVIGQIKRKRVREAFANGIGAQDIIDFFQSNAHPEMRKRKPILPENVSDQIRLWEREKHRVKVFKGFLYNSFASTEEKDNLVKMATDEGIFICESSNNDWVLLSSICQSFSAFHRGPN